MAESECTIKLDELLTGVQNVATQSDMPNVEKLQKICSIMHHATSIVKEYQSNVEVVTKDVDLVSNAAHVIGNQIACLQITTNNYSHKKLANRLKPIVKASSKQWLELFDPSMLGLKSPPISHSMFATFNPETPVIKVRQKRQRTQRDPVETKSACPDSIDKAEQTEETSAILEKVKSQIMRLFKDNKMKPIKYFQIVLDPEDFWKTVDNIFQVSFLVRDRAVELFEENEELWLRPLKKSRTNEQHSDDEQHSGDEQQVIMSIDMENWRALVKKYDVKRPMINISDRFKGKR
ncbi:non-structural maintenance of chromosomes element 4 homolog A-like [Ctenocephalides felis]|uniref:non-structural maintenance of chromosomes element 4 homolog A-like n=1 Tax=Ctenocephalides felis TaxID=7515 RepID=UPI000E6E3D3E|nr:non-structural maintenance of chromosomes element 4 homolog A-like [Ctenocephalides felis]